MALKVSDIEDDLRRGVARIDVGAPNAAADTWRAFLEHASKPIVGDSPPHPDNDVLMFEVERPRDAPGQRIAHLERRVGVETAELEYLGTLVAACWLTVKAEDNAWATLPDIVSIRGHGATAPPDEGLDLVAFRSEVEASSAFAALTSAELSDIVVSVSQL
jgi:hypothetical protein